MHSIKANMSNFWQSQAIHILAAVAVVSLVTAGFTAWRSHQSNDLASVALRANELLERRVTLLEQENKALSDTVFYATKVAHMQRDMLITAGVATDPLPFLPATDTHRQSK